jgi:hypothetical protein
MRGNIPVIIGYKPVVFGVGNTVNQSHHCSCSRTRQVRFETGLGTGGSGAPLKGDTQFATRKSIGNRWSFHKIWKILWILGIISAIW